MKNGKKITTAAAHFHSNEEKKRVSYKSREKEVLLLLLNPLTLVRSPSLWNFWLIIL